jgi:hypothetical protein
MTVSATPIADAFVEAPDDRKSELSHEIQPSRLIYASEAGCASSELPMEYLCKSLASAWELIAMILMPMRRAQGGSARTFCFGSLSC